MTTRTRIGICLVSLLVVVDIALLSRHEKERAVATSFVEWDANGYAVLRITNHESSPMLCVCRDGAFLIPPYPRLQPVEYIELMPRNDTQLLVSPFVSLGHRLRPMDGGKVSLDCIPKPSKMRERLEMLLNFVGINIPSTGFVVTVELPAMGARDNPTNRNLATRPDNE
jgi:hypothetical protein